MGEERINKVGNEALPKLEEDDAAMEQSTKRGEPTGVAEENYKRGVLPGKEEARKRGDLPGREALEKRGDLPSAEGDVKRGELLPTLAEEKEKRSALPGEEKNKGD